MISRFRSRRPRIPAPGLVVLPALVLVSACGGPPPAPPAEPLDAREVSLEAQRVTRLDVPTRILFDWSAAEQGARFSGRGVARLEPPYRARLDLFLPGGETVARAALVEGELRLPAGVPPGLIPPPRLLWASVGVVRPGQGAGLLGAEALDGGRVRLRYGYADGEEIRYVVRGGALEAVELFRDGDQVASVDLTVEEGSRYPREAVYRDLPSFQELRLTRTAAEEVEPFPPDIWNPGG